MKSKSDVFRTDFLGAVEEILQRTNFEDRTDNELDAYLNLVIEDLTHSLDRFASHGLSGTATKGAAEREKRMKEDRIKAGVVTLLNRHDLGNFDERRVRDLKDDLERSIIRLMGRLGAQPAEGFVGETAEDMIEMIHKQDWLIQQVLVSMGNYNLSDLTASETRELHSEIESILKGLDN